MPQILLTTLVQATPQRCCELSLSVDAHLRSMQGSRERVVGGVTSGVMGLGDTVTWRATHFGIPFTMTSQITALDPPLRFVDEQVSGPFRRWWHEHRFEEAGMGTRMTDVVEFEAPAGPIGRAVNRLVLTTYLRRLLEQRNRWLADSASRRPYV